MQFPLYHKVTPTRAVVHGGLETEEGTCTLETSDKKIPTRSGQREFMPSLPLPIQILDLFL